MAKYLSQAKYTAEGLKGLLKDGGSARKKEIEKLLASVGGKLEAFYYAFGDIDLFTITEAPDNVTAASLSLLISSSGAVSVKIIPLLTPEEVDSATKITADYRPPGK